MLRVRSWLNSCHEELVFWGDLLLNTLLLLGVLDFVLDLVQVYVHVRRPATLTFVRTCTALFNQLSAHGVRMVSNSQMEDLFDEEVYIFDGQLALVIVNANDSVDPLRRHKNVLRERASHLRMPLIKTATRFDV